MKNNKKIYGVFREDRKTHRVEGYIEHSFSMGWSENCVRAWRGLEDANSQLDSVLEKKYGSDTKKYKYFMARLNTKNIPVTFMSERKFDWRNPRFMIVKDK